jgi:hypothetical protein
VNLKTGELMATPKNQQVADQTLKGAVVGAISYFLAKANIDPGAQAAIMPLVITGLAYASTLVGNKGTASFLDKASKELPDLVEEVTVAVEEKKAVAKKAVAKKAASPKA